MIEYTTFIYVITAIGVSITALIVLGTYYEDKLNKESLKSPYPNIILIPLKMRRNMNACMAKGIMVVIMAEAMSPNAGIILSTKSDIVTIGSVSIDM